MITCDFMVIPVDVTGVSLSLSLSLSLSTTTTTTATTHEKLLTHNLPGASASGIIPVAGKQLKAPVVPLSRRATCVMLFLTEPRG